MSASRQKDEEILLAVRGSRALTERGVRVEHGGRYGIMLYCGDQVIGLWSYFDGGYRFRTLANYCPSRQVATLGDVLACIDEFSAKARARQGADGSSAHGKE